MIELTSQVKIKMILTMFFAALVFSGCKKENSSSSPRIDKELVSNVRVLANNGTSAKIAFSLLNADEKLFLVQEQLDFVLENVPLNEQQKELVTRIKDAMPNDLYSNVTAKANFIKKFSVMEQEGLKLLGGEFMLKYFVKIVDIGNTNAALLPPPPPVDNDCKCSKSSDWCSDEGHDRYACGPSLSCTVGGGCGTLFLYDCDGTCQRVLG